MLTGQAAKKMPMGLDMKRHLQDADPEQILKTLETLTIVPQFLLDAVKVFTLPEEEQEAAEVEMPSNPNLLKFEIIEIFLANNDFVTKDEWVCRMREEVTVLLEEEIFPKCVNDQFRNALQEVDEELTGGEMGGPPCFGLTLTCSCPGAPLSHPD